ncbi:MAG: hypothetical protein ABEK50_05200 [bacterium]
MLASRKEILSPVLKATTGEQSGQLIVVCEVPYFLLLLLELPLFLEVDEVKIINGMSNDRYEDRGR